MKRGHRVAFEWLYKVDARIVLMIEHSNTMGHMYNLVVHSRTCWRRSNGPLILQGVLSTTLRLVTLRGYHMPYSFTATEIVSRHSFCNRPLPRQ